MTPSNPRALWQLMNEESGYVVACFAMSYGECLPTYTLPTRVRSCTPERQGHRWGEGETEVSEAGSGADVQLLEEEEEDDAFGAG